MSKLNELALDIHRANKSKGFYEDYENIKAVLNGVNSNLVPMLDQTFKAQRFALIASEVFESFEAMRSGKICPLIDSVKERIIEEPDNEDFKHVFKTTIKDTVEDEVADVFIRLLDFAAFIGMDLDFHVDAKLRYNSLRPHKHNKLI